MSDFEELAQRLADALHSQEDARWEAGDLLAQLGPACPPLRQLAGAVGVSAAYLSVLRKVAQTFAPDTRAADQKWALHVLAARASDPEMTLEEAIANGWSPRDLEGALIDRGVLKKRQRRNTTELIQKAEERLRAVYENGVPQNTGHGTLIDWADVARNALEGAGVV